MSRLFSLDLSDGKCHRAECWVCKYHKGKGSSKCRRKSVVYESRCQICYAAGSTDGVYVGETGRSLFERSEEHLEDARNLKKSSHIFKHWALSHPDELHQPLFTFRVVRQHKTPLDRQVHEAIRIGSHGNLNSKSEYRQNQIKRLSVNLTAKELKEVERDLVKDEAELELAMTLLSNKVSNNVVSNLNSNHSSSLREQVVIEPFTDLAVKRKLTRCPEQPCASSKKTKLEATPALCPTPSSEFSCPIQPCDPLASSQSKMGRRSHGKTQNESKNLPKEPAVRPRTREILRSLPATPTPSSFAEACILGKKKQAERERSFLKLPSPMVPPSTPTSYKEPQFKDCSTMSSPLSDCSGLPSPSSPELKMVTTLDQDAETQLNCQILQLTLDTSIAKSEDSFSSAPETKFNKGAGAFLELVEKIMKRKEDADTALRFESLLVEMMDLSMDRKLGCPFDIPAVLADQGWNPSQVAGVCHVSTSAKEYHQWDSQILDDLGGKGVASRVWHELKARELTGNPKRRSEDPPIVSCKKLRCSQDQPSSLPEIGIKGTQVVIGLASSEFSTIETPQQSSTPSIAPTQNSDMLPRKNLKAKRKSVVSTPKITRWLVPGEKQKVAGTPDAPDSCSQSLAKSGTQENKRKRRRKTRSSKMTPSSLESADSLRSPPSLSLPCSPRSLENPSLNENHHSSPARRARKHQVDNLAIAKPNLKETGNGSPSDCLPEKEEKK